MSRPFRYTFILIIVAAAVGLAAAGGWRYARASAPVSGPIIVISIDTLRADHLPVYGYRSVKTPSIDALAADGVVFERAYSHAPETLPAHAALLSGRLPFETGVRDNVGFALRSGERLLQQMLHDRGFVTGGVVSSALLGKETGIGQGFDFFDADVPGATVGTAARIAQRDGGESEAIAEKWLNGIGTSRAFLFLHLDEPHAPYAPPERFAAYAPYDGEIAYADEIVGRLIKYLKSHQLYDRSTIVLLSDHGEGLGDHGEQEHGLFLYEESIRVPLIVKQESNAGAGRRVADVVQHVDVVPTVLDFAKAPAPGQLRGRSLKPLLEGNGRLEPPTVYSEALSARYQFGWSGLTALTDDRYQYIRAPREELYDRRDDRRERTNVAADPAAADALERMRRSLEKISAGATLPPPAPLSSDARDRLRALGYASTSEPFTASPVEPLADPKDKLDVAERYRAALDAAGDRKWPQAVGLLQQVLRDDPGMAGVWAQLAAFASRIDRLDVAADACRHLIALRPDDAEPHLAAAGVLLRMRKYAEAREHAETAARIAPETDTRTRASAHEIAARIAVTQRDFDRARAEANLGYEADTAAPIVAFVEGRIQYEQGHYADAMPSFEQAIGELRNPRSRPIPDLYYYAGDTLSRLERYHDAEAAFSEELKLYPLNVRARGALATLYQTTGRPDEAQQAVSDMLRVAPTPESYALANRLLTAFGQRQEAEAVKLEGRRTFGAAAPTRRVEATRDR